MPARTVATFAPPVMEARRWIAAMPKDAQPLINVSQAAPTDPPPEALRTAIAEMVMTDPDCHLYGEVLGWQPLRDQVAQTWSADYAGEITPAQVAITSGCNQAFAAAIATLCGDGDEVILPSPWYFNHKMWLDMSGVKTVPLPVGVDLLPDLERAESLITPKTRAIVLVTPNNPCGVEYPGGLVEAFFDLAARHGLALIVDETYRDFDSREAPVHGLFQRDGWDQTLIHLYSFSKAYRLTGHRVGAMLTSPARLSEAEKFLDTVTICPNQIGQRAALWGMQNLADWVAGERAEILRRRAAIQTAFAPLRDEGWQLLGSGGFFAYARHPWQAPSGQIAPALVKTAQVLTLPGTMFTPTGDSFGQRTVRLAFANLDCDGIAALGARLSGITL